MAVIIGADKAGTELKIKETVKSYLIELGKEVVDSKRSRLRRCNFSSS